MPGGNRKRAGKDKFVTVDYMEFKSSQSVLIAQSFVPRMLLPVLRRKVERVAAAMGSAATPGGGAVALGSGSTG